jgi:LacI family transcriptional regulator
MQQIADYLGVSKFAVSIALSGKEGVSAETRERVYRAANELGYFSQKYAKSFHGQGPPKRPASGVIVVLFPDIRYQIKESSYWSPIVNGITEELKSSGYNMVAITEVNGDHALKVINPGMMDGVISVGPVSEKLLTEVCSWGTPLVTIDNELPEAADSVFINNFDSVRMLTNQLIGMGHRSFQYVGDIRYARSFYDRWIGFRAALEDHGIPYTPEPGLLSLGEDCFYKTDEIKQHIAELLQRDELPGVFVCACDKIAMMTVAALAELELNVPRDCSVTGFDDIEEAVKCTPQLTTVQVPKQWLGIRAVRQLLWRIQSRETPPEKILLPGQILIRESASIPPVKQTSLRA